MSYNRHFAQMVEDVEILVDGCRMQKTVLYLTNDQCSMVDDRGVQKCIDALDLGKRGCVIHLLAAEWGAAEYTVHSERHGDFVSPQQYGADLGLHDARIVKRQLDLFMKKCILPLARRTHALIICSGCNDDDLSVSLERAAAQERKRLGSDCAYRVLSFAKTYEVHFNACERTGLAGQVSRKCNA